MYFLGKVSKISKIKIGEFIIDFFLKLSLELLSIMCQTHRHTDLQTFAFLKLLSKPKSQKNENAHNMNMYNKRSTEIY